MECLQRFGAAISHFAAADRNVLFMELLLAARAYDKAAEPVVGIGPLISKADVVEYVLSDELNRIPKAAREKKKITLDAVTFLYGATNDERDEYWLGVVTDLLVAAGVGSKLVCERSARRQLKVCRANVYLGLSE